MCGRYASFRQAQDIADEFDVIAVSQAALDLGPSWNIPPTTQVRIIIDRPASALERFTEPLTQEPLTPESLTHQNSPGPSRAMVTARWGLVPPWAQSLSVGARMINARSETAATKPSFRQPFSAARCLVVADGYYEWHTGEDGTKTPFYIHPSGGESLALAGLFSWWPDPHQPQDSPDRWVLTTTILTAAARDGLEEIHEREPVMLAPDLTTPWLDPGLTDPEQVHRLISEPGPELSWHPVSRAVGSVRNNGPHLIDPARPPQQGSLL